ncbi:hypothetical protein GHK92_07580 [Nocardioides sp. dk4132]|uniref:hypothetical protein n=1 Tax=unclassified Nocardioides TaxID=2615069 RepID=UPI001294D278|nr:MULTISPECIES: hypothetical protein [unclassified Nocardioides]MQW75729.1 hypothetical protein [Nocardioides sp. dk4132]QGA08615.1 hypothetical protein GFH29_15330 [Nocardioides sp. dk884]
MRRSIAIPAVLATCLFFAACGEDDSDSPTGDAAPQVIEVTIQDGTVTPNGERVRLEQGQDVEFLIDADKAGELHVHTDGEGQTLPYNKGVSTLELPLDESPGQIEVETHDPDVVVVLLEIR